MPLPMLRVPRVLTRALCSLALILFVAAVLRGAYAWQYARTHTEHGLGTIPFLFEPGNIAAALASGEGFSNPLRVPSGPTAWMTPVYPAVLAGIFRIAGLYTYRSWQIAVLFNVLCGVLTCIPIYLAGRNLANTTVASIAAWLWAVFPNAWIVPVESMWEASLAALLAACVLWLTLQARSKGDLPFWCGYGLLWGLTLMTNATLVLAFPFLLVWMARRSGASAAVTTCLVAIICCVPWTIRNHREMHAWIPFRSVTGVSLWMGTIDPDAGRWPGSFHPLSDASEREKFLAEGEVAYMRNKLAESLDWIEKHPTAELRLAGQRVVGFWAGGDLHPFRDFARSRSIWFRWIVALNLFTTVSAAGGVWVLWRRRHPLLVPFLVFPLVIPLPYYLTLVSARYRLIVDPAVMVLAAVGLQRALLDVFRSEGAKAGS